MDLAGVLVEWATWAVLMLLAIIEKLESANRLVYCCRGSEAATPGAASCSFSVCFPLVAWEEDGLGEGGRGTDLGGCRYGRYQLIE